MENQKASASHPEIAKALQGTKDASYILQQSLTEPAIKKVLRDFAATLRQNTDKILDANACDLAKMDKESPLYDRLLLNADRITTIAADVEKIADLPTPVGTIMDRRTLESGIELTRVRVPLGVVGVIYESRPNVTMDVFALCLRTRNACVLRGGTDAIETNKCTVALIQDVLKANALPAESVFLMPPDRDLMPQMLTAQGLIDVIIPRGSQALIDSVRKTASVPVIETGAGVVHIYFDAAGDAAQAAPVIANAKTRRPSVCNTLDTLLIHESRLCDLPLLAATLADKKVTIHADPASLKALAETYPETLLQNLKQGDEDREYLSLHMNVISVADLNAALAHIRAHGSGHTEAIMTLDNEAAEKFLNDVDAAVVVVNASTSFSDGGQFGLGAEIGISTQKLHARGPMGLEALTAYKWQLRGRGQTRP